MKHSIIPAEHLPDQLPSTAAAGAIVPQSPGGAPNAGDWGAGEDESQQGAASLRRYWAAVKRFWWLIAGLTALGTAAGIIATRYIDPVYEAHGAVWISDAGSTGANNGGPLKAPTLLPDGSWIELFRSFAVVDRVVAKERLWYTLKNQHDSAALAGLEPTRATVPGDYTLTIDSTGTHYVLSELRRGVVDKGMVGDSVGRPVGFAWAPTAANFHGKHTIGFWVAQPRPIAIDLIKRLDLSMTDHSNFLKVTLTGPDKWQTADLLNVWMQEFVDKAADLRRRNMSDVARILEVQRSGAEASLQQAEQALQNFRSQTITAPSEGVTVSAAVSGGSASDMLAGEFFKTQSDYEDVKRDRQALDSIAIAARQGNVSPEAITAIPAAQNAPSLMSAVKELLDKEAQLRDQQRVYTDAYKPVSDLKATVQTLREQTIPQIAATAAAVLQRRERELAQKLRTDSSKLEGIPARSIEEARLRRNLSVAENLYTTLENRYESTHLGAASTVPDVSILDPALPSASPQRNTIIMLVAGGVLGSLALGVIIALLLDLLDHRFRYAEQITHELKLGVLGAVPSVPKPGDSAADPEAMLQSVEAFRGLRLNLHHAFDAPPVILTVTSPGAGDGKSMIASNLALSFAQAGYRTLLIDGDIRRGKLHAVFGLERRPGLLDYLAGNAELPSIMQPVSEHGSLTVITCGTRRHRGPELLMSARLMTLLNQVRPRFDAILVDCAPLAAGMDAYALGVATGSAVLVMRTGLTDRRVAKAKLKLMERFPVRVLGAIVNAVPASELYTEYSYLYGYAPDTDTDLQAADSVPMLQAIDRAE